MVSLMLLSDGSWFSLCLLAMAREGAGDIIGAVDTGQECQALRCHGACTRDATVVSRELSFCFLFILNVD